MMRCFAGGIGGMMNVKFWVSLWYVATVSKWCLSRGVSLHKDQLLQYPLILGFCRALLCISAAYAFMRCLSVCLSVTFMDHVKTNKRIFKIFSPSGSQAIVVFPYQNSWHYSDGNFPNGSIKYKGDMKKWRFLTNISLYLRNDAR